MIYQDANQTFTYWCVGELPKPRRIYSAAGDFWLTWVWASARA